MRYLYPWRQHVLCMLPLLAFWGGVMAMLGNEDAVEAFFLRHRTSHPIFTEVVEDVSDFGSVGFYCVYAILLGCGLYRKKKSLVRFVLHYLIALAATLLLVEAVKYCIGRPRPPTDGDFLPFSPDRDNQSFPSGHVSESVVTITPLATRYGQVYLPLTLGFAPVIMGLTRLYLGEHHPSDFLGSMVAGSIGLFVAWHLSRHPLFKRLYCPK